MVYFKGLVLDHTTDGKNQKIVPNQKRNITFYDANRQKVADVSVTSNEYGSFKGSFTAPSGGLLGQMYLEDSQSGSTKYFRVEEYKRPKFEVIALPIKESFEINDSVKVQGHAKAYAGNNIDGAKVTYRVVRQARFPYWLGSLLLIRITLLFAVCLMPRGASLHACVGLAVESLA